MSNLRTQSMEIDKRLESKKITSLDQQVTYYSSWKYTAIHVLTILEEYQDVNSICKRLELSSEDVISGLNELRKMGLVKKMNNRWKKVSGSIHLPKQSKLSRVNHLNWRLKAMEDVEGQYDGLHFSAVYSLSKKNFDQVNELIINSIEKIDDKVLSSKNEDAAVLCVDLFKL